ncbi:MAG: NAD-dependent epimerase/dehydratase family protein [Acidimicrobiia bacterium]
MLTGEKILITGPAGRIAEPLCKALAADNDVWGVARFSDEGARARIDAHGVTTRVVDLATGDFSHLPDDFTIVLHIAADLGLSNDFDFGMRVNAEGTGLLLQHCRRAKAALVMSTGSVYKPHTDPMHPFIETDALGVSQLPAQPSYSIIKIAEEAVARYAARAFDLPVVIARMNAAYGDTGGLPAMQLATMLAGDPVVVRNDPCPYSPIHTDDIVSQLEAMLSAASTPANIVNWGGDEPVGPQQWCPYLADLAGVEARLIVQEAPGAQLGCVLDTTKRRSITGPCNVGWRDGMRRMFNAVHP